MEFPPLPPPENNPELYDIMFEAIFERYKKRVDAIVNMEGKNEEFLTMPPEKVFKLLRGEVEEEKIKFDMEHKALLEHIHAKIAREQAVYRERENALQAKLQEVQKLRKKNRSDKTLLQTQMQHLDELKAKLKMDELKLIAAEAKQQELARSLMSSQ
jgi:hypothetical protein